MQSKREFQSILTYDLAASREFNKGCESILLPYAVLRIVAVSVLLFYVVFIVWQGREAALDFFRVAAIYTLLFVGSKLINRNGSIGYKQMLSNHDGQPARFHITIADDKIHETDMKNGNFFDTNLERIYCIGESKNYLILLMDYKQGMPIDKRTLTGGTLDELKNHLLSACSGLKKRKICNGKRTRIGWGIFKILLVIDIVLALMQFF